MLASFMVVDATVDEAINNSAEVYFSFLGLYVQQALVTKNTPKFNYPGGLAIVAPAFNTAGN